MAGQLTAFTRISVGATSPGFGPIVDVYLDQPMPVRIRPPVHSLRPRSIVETAVANSSVYTSRVLVHGFDSKSNAAGFKSSAVCRARNREQLATARTSLRASE